jgi:hypothetical protein
MKADLLADVGRIWVQREKTFPFEKEIVLFLFKTSALWPEFGPRRAFTAKLLAGVVTLQHYDAKLRPRIGTIKSAAELRRRLAEPWYKQFEKHFLSQKWIGGIAEIINIHRTRRQQDAIITRAKRSRAISIDILDYLLRATNQAPEFAQVNIAEEFILANGFERPDRYDMRRGERKKDAGIGYDKVHNNWKHSKRTLGIDFVISKEFAELDALRLTDPYFLPTLSQLANDDQKIRTILAQYHWLRDFFIEKQPAMGKVRHWPCLPYFCDRQPLDIELLTEKQLQTAKTAMENSPK